jgi:RNA-binding protein 15
MSYRGPPPPPPSKLYKVLCVSSLHPKASDDVIRDTLYREYRKYGDISVRVVVEPDERVAFVYFRSFEDAREARHSRSRLIVFDRVATVEPVYESRSQRSSRDYHGEHGRSHRDRERGRMRDRERERSPLERDYYKSGYHHLPPRRSHSRGGHDTHYGRGYDLRMELGHKKERFPNYLSHVLPEDDPLATRTLFVGNLELDITDLEIEKIFRKYGHLVDIDIKKPSPGTGNAYAFIRYENLDMAHRAKVELSGQYIGKFQCKIGYGKANPTCKVWVGGLGPWCTEMQLWKEFDRFGVIKKIEYAEGDTCAHVFYEMLDAAQTAVQEMRGFPLGGPEKRLRIDFADIDLVLEGPGAVQSEGRPRLPGKSSRSSFVEGGKIPRSGAPFSEDR